MLVMLAAAGSILFADVVADVVGGVADVSVAECGWR